MALPSLTNTREQLEALRKSAPRQARLSVSRGARTYKARSSKLHTGTGNLPRYVANMLAKADMLDNPRNPTPADRRTLDFALRKAERFITEHGHAPYKEDIL